MDQAQRDKIKASAMAYEAKLAKQQALAIKRAAKADAAETAKGGPKATVYRDVPPGYTSAQDWYEDNDDPRAYS